MKSELNFVQIIINQIILFTQKFVDIHFTYFLFQLFRLLVFREHLLHILLFMMVPFNKQAMSVCLNLIRELVYMKLKHYSSLLHLFCIFNILGYGTQICI